MIAMIMAPSIEAPGILVTWLSIPPHSIANGSDVSLPLDTITTNHSQTNAQLTNIIQAPSLTNKGLFFLFSFLCFLLLLRVVSFNDFHPILRIFPMYYWLRLYFWYFVFCIETVFCTFVFVFWIEVFLYFVLLYLCFAAQMISTPSSAWCPRCIDYWTDGMRLSHPFVFCLTTCSTYHPYWLSISMIIINAKCSTYLPSILIIWLTLISISIYKYARLVCFCILNRIFYI